ncbi:hypothetical protein KJ980_02025 [Patescibacteria group bacterium]|nr:hypothetical protein [Patescibacteria group bacterium]MBU4016905.1 hypothetical protein [Patescibacteria group bacterium]MBU4098407.1 hypothetical protein [Patescibacteria group bacterium]
MSFKFTDYILTPKDLLSGFLRLVKKATLKENAGMIALLVSFFLLTHFYLQWQIDSCLFLIFFFALILWDLDSRISFAFALVCLIFCPFLLAFENNFIYLDLKNWAEQFAVWAYYFLVIGVVKSLIEYKQENKEQNENEK